MFRRKKKTAEPNPAALLPAAPVDAVQAAHEHRTLTKIGGAVALDQLKTELTAVGIQGKIALAQEQTRQELARLHREEERAEQSEKKTERSKFWKGVGQRIAAFVRKLWELLCSLVRGSADALGVSVPVIASGIAAWYGQFLFFSLVIGWRWELAAGAAFAIETAYFGAFSRARKARDAGDDATLELGVGWLVVAVAAGMNGAHAIIKATVTPEQAAALASQVAKQPEAVKQLTNLANGSITASIAVGFLSVLGPMLWELHERRKWRNVQIALEKSGQPHALLPRLSRSYRREFPAEARLIRREAVRRQVEQRYRELLNLAEAEASRQQAQQEAQQQRAAIARSFRMLGLGVQLFLRARRLRGAHAPWPQPITTYTLDASTVRALSTDNGQSAAHTPGQSLSVTISGQEAVRPMLPTTGGTTVVGDNADTRDSGQSAVPAPAATDNGRSRTHGQSAVPATSFTADSSMADTITIPAVPLLTPTAGALQQHGQSAVPANGRHHAQATNGSPPSRMNLWGSFAGTAFDQHRDTGDSGQSPSRDNADTGQSAVPATSVTSPRSPLPGTVDSPLSPQSHHADSPLPRPEADADNVVSPAAGEADSALSRPAAPAHANVAEDTPVSPADNHPHRADNDADNGQSPLQATTDRDGQWTVPGDRENGNRPVTQLVTPDETIISTGVQVILEMWQAEGEQPRQADVLNVLRGRLRAQGLGMRNKQRSAYWRSMLALAKQQRKISA